MEYSLWHNHTQLQALKSAYLHANPDAEKLLRYVQMDLNHVEIGKLLGVSASTVRDRLKRMAQMGLADYVPNPKYQHPRTLGHHVQAQLALEA
ncbi:winged helix-turn-helix transcriptional regulator [Kingella kingae]|uniref:winged helix-turn-helix transcriptional regulator n=1 Tax=Kingella kingae TaxID=504 RepID=UPI00255502E0|nr:winged helix-turn-helix transcriptional regulator [Kingella kingae]MDK4624192.1 winged helix-turn-helix transcriptional regulator [Kingella kingae]MDK4659771.1 winged helix-turn-helix transcriptional regulator [Kingella kingae]MDK4667763.1 winged helix-turn-helix transcriptional regulator [Kingella kingae]MDK4686125.1 winged helix-turn-helix transcriptional regulator [Kingella kingae]